MASSTGEAEKSASDAPYPGSRRMPRWELGKLHDAPIFTWRSWTLLLGPGLVMGASAIGGGEWLTGPLVTARYGAALFWLSTISILVQVLYNIEISRYTLYSGEPIFTGKFRTLPGPIFWLGVYVLLDFGSVLPYLASNAAIPLAAILLGHLPDPAKDVFLIKSLGCAVFVFALTPVILGGKIYNWLKALMSFKLVYVMGFLLFLAIVFSTFAVWKEIAIGFVSFGNVPVIAPEGAPEENVANVFTTWWKGDTLPPLDLSMLGILAAMAAISGNGGLTNTPISNYTRDQGWGMGREVGAIPSVVGAQQIELSHVGKVFHVTQDSLRKWFGWMRHVQREQLVVWMPACFLGLALPSMLSLQFLPRGTVLKDPWLAAGMTADGVANAVGESFGASFGPTFWYFTLFCGFLILSTAMAMTADGCLRRWVDVSWTAVPALRKWDSRHIGRFYFFAMCFYLAGGLFMLTQIDGAGLLVLSTMMYNYALGFSCWHALAVNTFLLPRELRPSLWRRAGLFLGGTFFLAIAVVTTIDKAGVGNLDKVAAVIGGVAIGTVLGAIILRVAIKFCNQVLLARAPQATVPQSSYGDAMGIVLGTTVMGCLAAYAISAIAGPNVAMYVAPVVAYALMAGLLLLMLPTTASRAGLVALSFAGITLPIVAVLAYAALATIAPGGF